ncbi:MAG: hypothetical protein ACRDTU_08435 [Micromonosporaceae bacterium]
MTRPEITDPDWIDPQEGELLPEGPTSRPIEAPEADAAEQSRSVRPDGDVRPSVSLEVNEADAVEQSRAVADDDEYDR